MVPPPNKKGFVAAIVLTDGISGAADFHRDASALLWSAATEHAEKFREMPRAVGTGNIQHKMHKCKV